MIRSNRQDQSSVAQEQIVRRRRYQKGSLQLQRRGKVKTWIVLYYDTSGDRRCKTLGPGSLTKSQAGKKRAEFMREVNGGEREDDGTRRVLLTEFVEKVYLPFQRGKWKASTAWTSENRIQHHIVKELGSTAVESFTLKPLQEFLERKATGGLSFSIVNHLRWDLRSIFEMAVAEKVIGANPSTRLYTPKSAEEGEHRVMTAAEVELAVGAVQPREKLLLHLAIFSGFRPGEMLALRRRDIGPECRTVAVEQRVYNGKFDHPKNGKTREVAVPPRTAALLGEWLDDAVGSDPDAWLFPSEVRDAPIWRENLLRRHIQLPLEKLGLGWVDFRVMRRTNASLGHDAKVDPKVSADQRGHGIGVSLDVYTKTSIEKKALAATKLEKSVLGRKVVRMPKKKV